MIRVRAAGCRCVPTDPDYRYIRPTGGMVPSLGSKGFLMYSMAQWRLKHRLSRTAPIRWHSRIRFCGQERFIVPPLFLNSDSQPNDHLCPVLPIIVGIFLVCPLSL